MSFSKTLFFSIFMVVLYYCGIDMYSPALPQIGHYFQIDSSAVRWTVSIFIITFSLSQFILGIFINQFHHKSMAMFFCILFIIGSLMCEFSPNIYTLYIARVIQSTGAACLFALGFATLNNNLHGDALAKALPINSLMYIIFAAIAPVIGGYLTVHINWQASFFAMVCFGIILLVALKFMYQTEQVVDEQPINILKTLKGYWGLIGSPLFLINSLMAVNALVAIISFYTLMPFIYIRNMGGNVENFSWFAFYFVILMVLSRLIHLVYLRKVFSYISSIKLFSSLIFIGAILLLFSTLVFDHSLMWFIVSYSLIIIGGSFVNPNCQVLSFISISKSQAGHASVLFGFFGSLYIALASSVSASIPDTLLSLAILMLVVSVFGVIGAVLNCYFSKR